MRICEECGNQVDDNVYVCDKCGYMLVDIIKTSPSALSIIALILAIIAPPIGLILGIVDIVKKNARNKILAIISVVISSMTIILTVVVLLIFGGILAPTLGSYINMTNVAEDETLCVFTKNAIVTAMSDPDVVASGNIPNEHTWTPVSNLENYPEFAKAFEESFGQKPSDLESEIKSSFNGKKASGLQYKMSGVFVEVRIENSLDPETESFIQSW